MNRSKTGKCLKADFHGDHRDTTLQLVDSWSTGKHGFRTSVDVMSYTVLITSTSPSPSKHRKTPDQKGVKTTSINIDRYSYIMKQWIL